MLLVGRNGHLHYFFQRHTFQHVIHELVHSLFEVGRKLVLVFQILLVDHFMQRIRHGIHHLYHHFVRVHGIQIVLNIFLGRR